MSSTQASYAQLPRNGRNLLTVYGFEDDGDDYSYAYLVIPEKDFGNVVTLTDFNASNITYYPETIAEVFTPGILLRDMGKEISVIGDNQEVVMRWRKVQVMRGDDSEGVGAIVGYVLVFTASPGFDGWGRVGVSYV